MTSTPVFSCIDCHQSRDAQLISQWQASGHSRQACSSCHQKPHQPATARKDSSCTHCHENSDQHSYQTSKHGVINTIERLRTDWQKPLQADHYRSPGCAYCHLQGANHDTRRLSTEDEDSWLNVCRGCHSPRFISTQWQAGQDQKRISELKSREIMTILQQAQKLGLPAKEYLSMVNSLKTLEQNIRLGIGHQSPDYQWWLGQPALDGLLIKAKGWLTRLQLSPRRDNSD